MVQLKRETRIDHFSDTEAVLVLLLGFLAMVLLAVWLGRWFFVFWAGTIAACLPLFWWLKRLDQYRHKAFLICLEEKKAAGNTVPSAALDKALLQTRTKIEKEKCDMEEVLFIGVDVALEEYVVRTCTELGLGVVSSAIEADIHHDSDRDNYALVVVAVDPFAQVCARDRVDTVCKSFPASPVVALAHCETEKQIKACSDAGVVELLAMPFELAFLKATIQQILELAAERAAGTEEAISADKEMPPPQLLLIDDEPEMGRSVRRMLGRDRQLDVMVACSGQAGLDAAHRTHPDLVLLDVRMPGMDGIEVLRALKADERTRTIPVVMLSAMNESCTIEKAMAEHAEQYVVKPVAPPALRQIVQERLGERIASA